MGWLRIFFVFWAAVVSMGMVGGSTGQEHSWCVVNTAAVKNRASDLEISKEYACMAADCSAIEPGKSCYEPNTLESHASYAFNAYWGATKVYGGTCDFLGMAVVITQDPSYGGCHYPYVK